MNHRMQCPRVNGCDCTEHRARRFCFILTNGAIFALLLGLGFLVGLVGDQLSSMCLGAAAGLFLFMRHEDYRRI